MGKDKVRLRRFTQITPLLPALAATVVYLAVNGGDDFGMVCYRAVIGISGCLMALLFFLSWKAYQNERVPMKVSILLGIAAAEASYIVCYGDADIIFQMVILLMMLFPVILVPAVDFFLHKLSGSKHVVCVLDMLIVALICVLLCKAADADLKEDYMIPIIWLSEGAIWSIAVNAEGSKAQRRASQWKAWLATMGILYLYICIGDELWWEQVQLDILNHTVMACVPVLYPLLFYKISDRVCGKGRHYILKGSMAYFIAVLIITCFFSGSSHLFMSGYSCSPDMVFYSLLMADIVYAEELYQYRKKNKAVTDWKSDFEAGFSAVISNIAAAVFVFFGNERVRTILYDIGFKGINIDKRDRVDWIGYRITAVKCFFAGDAAVYRHGCPELVVMALLVLAAAIFLIKLRSNDIFTNHCVKYPAVSYMVRAAEIIFFRMFLFTSYDVQIPFTGYAMADIVVLAILVSECHNRTESDSEI